MQGQSFTIVKDFGEILSAELNKRGLTATALGRAVDISPAGMSNYKNGRVPKADELLRIADFLGVSMEYLLTGIDRVAAANKVAESPEEYKANRKPLRLPTPEEIDQVISSLEANLRALQSFKSSFAEAANVVPFAQESAITTELPLYGWVAAGKPSDVDYYTDETLVVPGDYRRRPHYLLRVRGQSMEPDYPDGSYVVVRALEPGEYPKKGDVVIAADGNGPAMKRLEYRKAGQKGDIPRKPTPHLVSINPAYGEVIPIADCPVQGVVIDCFPADFFES